MQILYIILFHGALLNESLCCGKINKLKIILEKPFCLLLLRNLQTANTERKKLKRNSTGQTCFPLWGKGHF